MRLSGESTTDVLNCFSFHRLHSASLILSARKKTAAEIRRWR
jgi:hypothetical protein